MRTRETIEIVASQLGGELSIDFDEDLYLASGRDLRHRIEQAPASVASVMLVGHNPGMEELALELAARGQPNAIAELRRKFPTGALAEFRIHAQRWNHLPRGGCELVAFVTPKLLPA